MASDGRSGGDKVADALPEILLAGLGAPQTVQQLCELYHATRGKHESHPGTAKDVDELVVLCWCDVVHLGVGAGDEHLLALLNEWCEDMRSNWHGDSSRTGACQVVGSICHYLIQHKGTGNTVHCTDAELLQIGGA